MVRAATCRYTHTHIYTHTHTHAHTNIHTHIHTHTHAYTHTSNYNHTHIHTRTHTNKDTHALTNTQPPGRRRGAPVYELIGISHHSGSLEGGHYTASARSAADGSWHSFNDRYVGVGVGVSVSGAVEVVCFWASEGLWK